VEVVRIGPEIILENLSETPKNKRSISQNAKNLQNIEKYIKFELRVEDSGYGISPENLPKLFMNFGKLEEHASGNKLGTGLGLSICKSLVELMGGSVRVESEVNKGTTFIMSLHTKTNFLSYSAARKEIKKFKSRLLKQPNN
jgi:signal transduction histidine kinase